MASALSRPLNNLLEVYMLYSLFLYVVVIYYFVSFVIAFLRYGAMDTGPQLAYILVLSGMYLSKLLIPVPILIIVALIWPRRLHFLPRLRPVLYVAGLLTAFVGFLITKYYIKILYL